MRNILPKRWRLISDLNGHAPATALPSANMNMAVDEAIALCSSSVIARSNSDEAISKERIASPPARNDTESKSTIRFYTWEKPALSIGYFQRINPVINWMNNSPSLNTPLYPLLIEEKGTIDIVRRPTGGGIVLHGNDLTYSMTVNTNAATTRNQIPLFYKQLGMAVIEGLKLLGINAELFTRSVPAQDGMSLCQQTPVESDVLVEGVKVAGCAARRFKEALLLQGYISIERFTNISLQQIKDAMARGFTSVLGIELEHGKLDPEEVVLAEELNNKKYSRNEWNYKR